MRGATRELKKIIKGYLGSAGDLAAIRDLAAAGNVEVVAVALDLGEGVELRELHDEAKAAGAVRCHTLDVREEFMREYVLPEIHSLMDADQTLAALASRLIARKLAEIAGIEGGAAVIAAPGSESEALPQASRRGDGRHLDRAAQVAIAFEGGVPVAINGIPMTLIELIDCLSTIATAHGVGGARPGLAVLQAAHRELACAHEPGTGSTHVEVFKGQLTPRPREHATT